MSGPDGPVDDACYHKCPPPAPSHGRGIFIITRLPGVTLRSPPAVYWPPFQGLRMLAVLWMSGFATVDFPALRARAHLSTPDGAVDYGPDDPVDYASGARCGLCGFALWSSGLEQGERGRSTPHWLVRCACAPLHFSSVPHTITPEALERRHLSSAPHPITPEALEGRQFTAGGERSVTPGLCRHA